MLKRIVGLIVAGLAALLLGGCMVAQSTYLKKVEEAEYLSREFADLKRSQEQLSAENSGLKTELADQTRQKQALEQLLASKTDALSQNVNDLRQKIAALEDENRELKKAREEKTSQLGTTYEKLLQDMKSEISQGQVVISELKGALTVTMEATMLFDSGRAEVKPEGQLILFKLVETLKGNRDRAIRVEGHTDNLAPSGALGRPFPTNWELSGARAVNVARYLQRQGVEPSLLSAVACGEHRPVADNATREGRARNRRIEITLVARD